MGDNRAAAAVTSFIDELKYSVPLSESEETIISAIGVTTYDELDAVARSFPSLSRVGVELPKLSALAFQRSAGAMAAMLESVEPERPPVEFGALAPPEAPVTVNATVGLPPPPAPAFTLEAAPPGGAIDLRLPMWPVRNQGGRGTCVAHATAACREHMAANGGAPPDLSEQFLYWAIKTHTADPYPARDGTWLNFARDALAADGICGEADWRYVPTAVAPVSGAVAGQPTAAAITAAHANAVLASFHAANPSGAAGVLLNHLGSGRPVAISLPVFSDPLIPDGPTKPTNWTTRVGWLNGRVLNPPPTSKATGGHCVCITGYVPDPAEPAGGYFIIRNSWDTAWGSANAAGGSIAPEPGYGSVSATYVNTYTWELFQI